MGSDEIMSFQEAYLKELGEGFIRETPTSTVPNEYSNAVWNLMIARGGAMEDQFGHSLGDYYSSAVDLDPKLTREILEAIVEHGIDADLSSDPAWVKDYRFDGTFTSSQLEIAGLTGSLFVGDGREVRWGATCSIGFGELIQLLTRLPDVDPKQIAAETIDRIDNFKHYGSGEAWRHLSYVQGVGSLW